MKDAWRYRCPRGHSSWRPRVSRASSYDYYCQTCDRYDHGECNHDHLIDAKTGNKVTP